MKGSAGKKPPLRRLAIILASIAGVFILLAVGLQLTLNSRLPARLVRDIAPRYVDADVAVGRLNVSLVRFPKVTLKIEDLTVCYPHDRFAAFDTLKMYCDGRSEESDTLLALAGLKVKASAVGALKGRFKLHDVTVSGLRMFARQFDENTVNWDVLRLPEKQDTTPSSGDISLKVKDFTIKDGTCLFYGSGPGVIDSLRVPVDFYACLELGLEEGGSRFGLKDLDCNVAGVPLRGAASLALSGERKFVECDLSMKSCPVGEIIKSYGPLFVPQAVYLDTDALLNASLYAEGPFSKDSTGMHLPELKLSVEIPEANLNYGTVIRDGLFDLTAEVNNGDRMDVGVPDFCFHIDGFDVNLNGGAKDVLGEDPMVTADADASLVLEKLIKYLPESLKDATASGNLTLNLSGTDVHLKNLGLQSIADQKLDAQLCGDDLRVKIPSKDIFGYVDNPKFRVQTMESMVDPGKASLGVKADLDSVDVIFKDKYVKGKNVKLFVQNALRQIDTLSKLSPMVGKITADRLVMRGEDSLVVGLANTSNTVSVAPSGDAGSVPKISLDSENGLVFFRNVGNKLIANDISLAGKAKLNEKALAGFRPGTVPDSTRVRRRPIRGHLRDTSMIPDYLREKDFYSSDIKLSLDRTLKEKLRMWNPSGKISVGRAMYMTTSFPVRNRLHRFDADFDLNSINIDTLRVTSGTSDLAAKGTLSGIRPILTGRGKGLMDLKLDLKSSSVNVNEILALIAEGKYAKEKSKNESVDSDSYLNEVIVDTLAEEDYKPLPYKLIVVPANLNADVNLSADKLKASKVIADSVSLDFNMRERCARFSDFHACTDMGTCDLDVFYSTRTKQDINVGFGLNVTDVTAETLIRTFPKIDSLVPLLKTFKGKLDLEAAATSKLDTNMNFILPSMNGMAKVHGMNLEIADFGALKSKTRLLRFRNPDSGRVDEMSVSAVLADNQLEVFPFIVSLDRYVVALNGSGAFNSGFDAHLSLIKSPLLFKLGVNAFGKDFRHIKYRIGRPKYNTSKIPLFNDELDGIKLNLVTSIKNIYSRGVDEAIAQNHEIALRLGRKGKELFGDSMMEELSLEELGQLEQARISAELDEETRNLNEEIDKLLEDF